MRKFYIMLCLTLLLGLSTPSLALTPDTAAPDGEFDGYLVKIREDKPVVFSHNMENTLEAVSDGLYQTDDKSCIDELKAADLVEYVEPNYKVYLTGTANDKFYFDQWNLLGIDASSAWDFGYVGQNVRVAVIDSGVNTSHEDFIGAKIDTGLNLIDGTFNIQDYTGHGTGVSGIIAAVRDNSVGIAGIADQATIVPFKCFNSTETSISYVISAIYQAVDNYNCDIINLSLGLEQNVKSFEEAVSHAIANNTIVIASSGNNGKETPLYPASYSGVIGVGATDKNNNLSSFSQRNNSVFVVAPGEAVISLDFRNNNAYVPLNGTSFSAPHVTALAAIARSYNPFIDTEALKALLIESSSDLGDPGYDTSYGHGLISAGAFVEALQRTPRYNSPPSATTAGRNLTSWIQYTENLAPVTYSVDSWFQDAQGDELEYYVHTTNASGSLNIDGCTLSYTPSKEDIDKSIRIVIAAWDGELVSQINAILSITVEADDVQLASVDSFIDLNEHWSKKYVAFCNEYSLFSGISKDSFAPDKYMSRAMFVTALARLSEADLSQYTSDFSDVPASSWYYGSVAWAESLGIINENPLFYPDQNITREDAATLLYRYVTIVLHESTSSDESIFYGYTDVDSISDYIYGEVQWATSSGLMGGRTVSTIDPKGSATRAEVSTILTRLIRSYL